MIENGFYKITQDYIELIRSLGGVYRDHKARPIFCCIEDKDVEGLYWAIPTSDASHRSAEQLEKIKYYCSLPARDIRSNYYYLGHTNRPAIYRISNCLSLTNKYVDSEYTSNGQHLILRTESDIQAIREKLHRILLAEQKHNNKFEQHITDIKRHLVLELT